jgi:hypothetical protein
MGPVTATFRFFGDVGAAYDSAVEEGAKSSFPCGARSTSSRRRGSATISQILSEVVAEFEPDTNEVGFELERLWGQYTWSDYFYAKLGREHSHGELLEPPLSPRPHLLARRHAAVPRALRGSGRPAPDPCGGARARRKVRDGIGTFGYIGAVSNGRGFETTEVANVQDRNDCEGLRHRRKLLAVGLPGLLVGANYRSDSIPANPWIPTRGCGRGDHLRVRRAARGRWDAIAEAATIEHDGRPRAGLRAPVRVPPGELQPRSLGTLREGDTRDMDRR